MPLPSPNLDDRSFEQLLDDAKALVLRSDCGWNDLGAGDPGAVLLEAFAHLTKLMLYRLNRLPEKVHVELLRMIGVRLAPPAAARAALTFSLARPQDDRLVIPAGTRVTVGRWTGSDPPVFETVRDVEIAAGATQVDGVLALHFGTVEAELAGSGTGLPAQSVVASQAPIIAPSGDDLDLLVGVEATPEELHERVQSRQFQGKAYRIWSEVENFAGVGADACVYVVDRHAGRITFPPALRASDDRGALAALPMTLARVPAAGRAIRLWYRRGGGEAGNVSAQLLTVMRDPIRGLQVTNPEPAVGGTAAESLDNAMLRGPQEMHSLRRAVTARDFEAVALRSSAAVARAKVFAKAALWKHAQAGTVEVLLVPSLATLQTRGGGRVTREAMQAQESDDVRRLVHAEVERRRTLGTECLVHWVRYKTVTVHVRVVVFRGEDRDAVRARVLDRLHLMLNALPTPLQRQGWPFGEPLRASHIYDIVLAERGVSYVDRVRFAVAEVPGADVECLAIDPVQPATWYASSGNTLYRSLNDGDSWEPAGRFPEQVARPVAASPDQPGLLAVATRLADDSARVHVSEDCGETWSQVADFAFPVNGLAWVERTGVQVLLMATDQGLYERMLEEGALPVQLVVDPAQPAGGFWSVSSFADSRGGRNVALAARQQGGVYISRTEGRTETYARIHAGGDDIRVLAAQRLGASLFLWAGIASAGNEAGKGVLRWELPSSPQSVESPDGWRSLQVRWQGGSCRALAFDGDRVYAGTHSAGVAWLDGARPEAGWQSVDIQCGLPMRAAEKLFAPVPALAVAHGGDRLMIGGPRGVYRRAAGAELRFEMASATEFAEKVALPATWLFCSGAHEVEVVSADDTR